jgi:hypothetical protein
MSQDTSPHPPLGRAGGAIFYQVVVVVCEGTMNLEQRVEMLEQELQILKSQIHATLLDLQEHILTNSYPTLRSDGPTPVAPVVPSPPPSEAETLPVSFQPGGPVRSVSVMPETPSLPGDSGGLPVVRKVSSLNDLQPDYVTQDRGNGYASDPPPVSQTIDDYPVQRPTHRDQAYSPAEGSSRRRTSPQQPARPFLTDDQDELAPPLITEADWASLELLEEWTKKRVYELGVQRTRGLIRDYEQQGRFNAEIRDALLQLVTIIEADEAPAYTSHPRLPANPKTNLPGERPTQPSRPRQLAEYCVDPGDEADATQNLVLRLIAGVQNAGAGITRRKKDG